MDAVTRAAEGRESMKKNDILEFLHWVAEEVIDEKSWDLNCISFPEIACRKLNKLGIIDTDGQRWIYTPPKEE